jgi:antirestriction protein ArdC
MPYARKSSEEHKDVYTHVTERIVKALDEGVKPWERPWNAGNADGRIIIPKRHNGEAYKGINTLMLWAEAMDKGYNSPKWMTFKQAQELKANVKKGEHGSLVVYAGKIIKTDTDDKGEEHDRAIPFMKGYTVFNVEQIEGLPEKYYAKPEAKLTPVERIEHSEQFFKNTGADIRIGGNRAFYAAEPDYIRMPPIEVFKDADSYYRTLAHEAIHWVKHEKRLNRDLGRKKWGDEGYSREEMVAELGSAYIGADLELAPAINEHAAYLGSWQKALKDDKHFIFTAAAHAQKAAEYLHGLQPRIEAQTIKENRSPPHLWDA